MDIRRKVKIIFVHLNNLNTKILQKDTDDINKKNGIFEKSCNVVKKKVVELQKN